MTKYFTETMDIPIEWLKRAQAVALILEEGGELRAFGAVTPQMVLRVALAHGLNEIERNADMEAPGWVFYQGSTIKKSALSREYMERIREHEVALNTGRPCSYPCVGECKNNKWSNFKVEHASNL